MEHVERLQHGFTLIVGFAVICSTWDCSAFVTQNRHIIKRSTALIWRWKTSGRIPLGQQECSPLDSEQSGPLQSSHRTLLLWHLSHDVVVISMSFNPVRLWACPSEELNLRNICIQSIENSPLCIEAAEWLVKCLVPYSALGCVHLLCSTQETEPEAMVRATQHTLRHWASFSVEVESGGLLKNVPGFTHQSGVRLEGLLGNGKRSSFLFVERTLPLKKLHLLI